MSTGDLEHSWAFRTTAAEETLLALSCPDIAPDTLPTEAGLTLAVPHLPRGRGAHQLLCEVPVCPKQRRDTGGPLAYPPARIQAAQGPLWEVLRWLERPACGVGAALRNVQQAWAALRRHLENFRALGPAYARLQPRGTPGRPAPLQPMHHLHATVRARLQAEDKGRLREWHTWLENAWTSDQGAGDTGSRTSHTPGSSPSSPGRMAHQQPIGRK